MYSFQSPFAYAANNPIYYNDYLGMGPREWWKNFKGWVNRNVLGNTTAGIPTVNLREQTQSGETGNSGGGNDQPPPCPGCVDLPPVDVEADRNVSSWVDEAAYWTQWVPVLGAGFSSASKTRKGDYWGAAGDFGIAMAEMFTLGYASKYTMPARAAANQTNKTSTKVISKSVGAAPQGFGTTLQTGGNTLKKSTLKALNLTKEQGNRAIHNLKDDLLIRGDFHGKIMGNGDVVHPNTGKVIGNLFDYLY